MSHSTFIWKCLLFGGLLTLVGVVFLGTMLVTWDWSGWPTIFLFFGPGALFFFMAYLKEFWF